MKALLVLSVLFAAANATAADANWHLELAHPSAAEVNQGTTALPPGMQLQKMVTLTTDRDADVYFLHLMQDTRSFVPTGMYVEPGKNNAVTPEAMPNGTPF